MQVLLMESTCKRLTPQAWHYLWSNGYKHVPDSAVGYSVLTFLAQPQQQDRSATQVMEKLRSVIHDPMTRPLKRKTHEVWMLVKHLQNKRKLQPLRHKFGVVITDQDAIGKEIAKFWQQTMSVTCPHSLNALNICTSFFKEEILL